MLTIRRILSIIVLFASAIFCQPAQAAPLNPRHFADKLAKIQLGQVAQETIMIFGDSVANRKPQYLTQALARAYGDLGTGPSYTISTTGDVIVNNGGTVPYDYTYHLTGSFWDVGVGGEAIFGRGGGAARANTIPVYYVKEVGAGAFKISVAIGNGAFTDEPAYTNVDASNATLALGIIHLSKAPGRYRVKLTGLTGRVKFYKPEFFDYSTAGVQVIHMDRGGLDLGQANKMDPALFVPYMQDLNPDVAFFEMKEAGTFAVDLATHISRFQAALPKMDWIYIGTTPDSGGLAETNNAITQSQAAAAGYDYWDGYTPCISFSAMMDIGWLTTTDMTHPQPQCDHYLARLMSRDLGLTEIIGEVSQSKVIADSVATRSVKVSQSYGTVDAVGSTFKAAIEITGPSDLDGKLNTQRNLILATGANGNANSTIELAAPITLLDGILDAAKLAATPGPAGTGRWRLYALLDGSGKVELVARFPTGTGQVVALEP